MQQSKDITQLLRKRKKKHDKKFLLAKPKLNNVKVLISKALNHCVKSVQIRSYFWFVFSCILIE